MKTAILLLAFSLAVLSSCTTSYKTGQTPDDVYYSPTRPQEEYVKTKKQDEKTVRYDDDYYEERYLRMKVQNRTRWSDLDDWYYNDYRYRYNVYQGCCFCNNAWSPYSHWNNYFNPYYQNNVIIKNVRTPTYNKPRTFNLNAYNQNTSPTRNYSNPKTSSSNNGRTNVYTAPRNSSSSNNNNPGGVLRDIFKTNSSSNSGSSTSGSNNTGTNTSSGSSSSGSSTPAAAPVRRF